MFPKTTFSGRWLFWTFRNVCRDCLAFVIFDFNIAVARIYGHCRVTLVDLRHFAKRTTGWNANKCRTVCRRRNLKKMDKYSVIRIITYFVANQQRRALRNERGEYFVYEPRRDIVYARCRHHSRTGYMLLQEETITRCVRVVMSRVNFVTSGIRCGAFRTRRWTYERVGLRSNCSRRRNTETLCLTNEV